jgi:integrase
MFASLPATEERIPRFSKSRKRGLTRFISRSRKSTHPVRCASPVAPLQMFFNDVLGRDWKLFAIVCCPDRQKLPIVLSREEVRRLLAGLHEPRFRVILQLIYSCGLRVGEAAGLCVCDIHAAESRIHIREAKGGKDRYVPLPATMLASLREFGKTHRHPKLVFPAVGRGWRERATPESALSSSKPCSPCPRSSARTSEVKRRRRLI